MRNLCTLLYLNFVSELSFPIAKMISRRWLHDLKDLADDSTQQQLQVRWLLWHTAETQRQENAQL